MGRLFWRILASFLVGTVLLAVGVSVGTRLYLEAESVALGGVEHGPRAVGEVFWVEQLLRHGGPHLLREIGPELIRQGRMPLVVGPEGADLLGRPVPPEVFRNARRLALQGKGQGVREVADPSGASTLIFVPDDLRFFAPPRRPPRVPMPFIFAGAAVLAGLAVSAWLARNLARRIHILRAAFDRLAGGAMDTRVAGTLTGSDEIVELGRDFDRMATHLDALVGAQRRLLHDVSHELRSPLARLQVAVGLARQQPDRTVQALERIERESERLNGLVEELLTLSRLESGRAPTLDAHIDLIELLQVVTDDARFEVQGDGKNVVVQDDGDGEVVLVGNGELLHRAFDNVLRNALRHSPAQGVVELAITRGRPGEICVAVSDRGPGLAEGELEHIFEPFVHGEGSNGAGLGLAIARRAVEAHGGHITANLRPGGGLVVSCCLPLKPASAG